MDKEEAKLLDGKTLEELKMVLYNLVFIENYNKAKLVDYVNLNMTANLRGEFTSFIDHYFRDVLKTENPSRKLRRRVLATNGHTFTKGLKKILKRAEFVEK